MSRSKKRSRKNKRIYTALAVVIFGEAVFISAIILPGLLKSQAPSVVVETPRLIIQQILESLIDPTSNSFINPEGLINNTEPIIMYIHTVTSPPYIECYSWPALYNASLRGIRIVLIILPDIRYQSGPASVYDVQRFIGYVSEICGFSIDRTNFMVTTAYPTNTTIQTNIGPVRIIGLVKLLQDLFQSLGLGNAYFPIVIGVGANDSVTANNIIYGANVNSSSISSLVRGLGG